MPHADINSPDKRKRWRARHPEKDRAHRAVEAAIRKGTLVRQPCYVPGCENQAQAHHDDYDKPLEIRKWACASHHIKDHWKESWREQRNGRAIIVVQETTIVEEDADADGRQPIASTLPERPEMSGGAWQNERVVAEADAKRGNVYRARAGMKRGKAHVGVREFFTADDGSVRPTRNGIDVPRVAVPDIVDLLQAAYDDRDDAIEVAKAESIADMLDRQARRAAGE